MKKRIVNYPCKQLFTPIPELKLYEFVSGDKVQTINGNKMPFMTWPDGTPCLLANAWLIRMRSQSGRGGEGPSLVGSKGGSFGDYASKISHLIRFCYYNRINFISLSDDDFYEFIDGLRAGKKLNKPEEQKRSERTITSIGRRCLSFLHFVGELNGFQNFVGIEGNISIKMIDSTGYRNGVAFKRSSVHHRSFRKAGPKKRRKPIAEATIDAMRTAINEMSTSDFLCSRRQLMISLFEELGGRRREIKRLKVEDIMAAAAMEKPELKLTTLKRGGNITRLIRITPHLLTELLHYIRVDRRKIVKKTIPRSDHGYLFINERGGAPLKTDSFTAEFRKIRSAAGIEVQVCAHLFRHAFCTNVVASLIAETEALSPDSFRLLMMTNKTLAETAMTETGHSTLEGLLTYVDDAFRKRSKFGEVVRNVETAKIYHSYERRRKHLLDDFKAGRISKEEYITREEILTKERDENVFED